MAALALEIMEMGTEETETPTTVITIPTSTVITQITTQIISATRKEISAPVATLATSTTKTKANLCGKKHENAFYSFRVLI